MTKLSDNFLKLAEDMVRQFGETSRWKLIKVERISPEDDPTAYEEEQEVTERFVDLAIISWKESDYNGETIRIGDKPAIMPATKGYPVPSIGDIFESFPAGVRYRVIATSKIFSVNGITVAYKLNLRG